MNNSFEEEMLKEFLLETKELIEKLENDFVELESSPTDSDLLNEIFRSVHTIKGGAGMMGNENLQTVAHRMEDILNKLRKGESIITSDITDPLLAGLDVLKQLTDSLEEGDDSADFDISVVDLLVETYNKMTPNQEMDEERKKEAKAEKIEEEIDEKAARLAEEAEKEQSSFEVDLFGDEMEELVDSFTIETDEILETLDQDLIQLEHNPDDEEILNSIFRGLHTIKGTSSFLGLDLITKLSHKAEDVLNDLRKKVLPVSTEIMDTMLETVDLLKELMEDVKDKNIVDRDISSLITQLLAFRGDSDDEGKTAEVKVKEKSKKEEKNKTLDKRTRKSADSTIRVDVERLDSLMNLVSEMVLRRNSLVQLSNNFDKNFDDSELVDELTSTTGHISYLTTELQFAVMQTRMLPIGKVFNKFTRIVRDLSKQVGKKIDLTIEGAETELDKSLIEEINDPLVHLIRNSVDHGIEPPDVRLKLGKEEVGKVKLYALQEGNNIIIGIDDDGKGLDTEMLKRKAVEKGVISQSEADRMSEKDAFNLILTPGFSTAETVSNISGRGVGMDVVKTNITKLNGIIDINSELGKGTSIVIKLPLTLAIIQGLLVEVSDEIFVIPLGSVLETARINVNDISSMNQMEAINLRGSILPLVRLDRMFNISKEKSENEEESFIYVVVVGLAEQKLGLVVSRMLGQEEVVIKSLGEDLGKTKGVSGATIMGDGRVRMILEIRDLFDIAAKMKHTVVEKVKNDAGINSSDSDENNDEGIEPNDETEPDSITPNLGEAVVESDEEHKGGEESVNETEPDNKTPNFEEADVESAEPVLSDG